MDLAVAELPNDVEALRAMVMAQRQETARLAAEGQRLEAEVDRLTAQNARWKHIVAQLRRLAFGKSSERLDPNQLQLGLEDL